MKRKLMAMLLAAGAMLGACADELTVHDGTVESSYVPVYGYYYDAYVRSQIVYPASDLVALKGRTITGLRWYGRLAVGDAYTYTTPIVIYLKEVEYASISALEDKGGCAVVYEGSLSIADNMLFITFDTPFVYNGGNLLIGVENNERGEFKTLYFSGDEVSGASISYYNYNSPSPVDIHQRNFIPKTTFVYCVTPAVTAVIDAIAAIGEVSYTDESKAKIDAARAAYNALTDAQKALVANYATLTAAEEAYAALVPAPCYELIDESDIVAPYAAPKAVTLLGAAYDGCDVVGIVELKLGKVNAKKKTSKVSGSVTTLDGKKHTVKGVTVAGIDGTAPAVVSLAVKDMGTLSVTIGGTQFAGTLGGTFHVQSASVGGAWAGGTATATVEINDGDLDKFPGTLLATLLPDGETATVKNSKWTFAKAATVKWAKAKGAAEKSLIVDTSKGKTNLSGLKLTYTPKKGTFKGSFKVYALDGSGKTVKLNKYTFNVSGFVFDGVGYGKATCKKPAVSWSVTVE